MKRIAVVPICCLILASPAWASLKISVNGKTDLGTVSWIGDHTLGIVGDGKTQSPVACWLLFTQLMPTTGISGAKMLYQGTLSEYWDIEEVATETGVTKQDVLSYFVPYAGHTGRWLRDLAFITLADGALPPMPLNGVLVDNISYRFRGFEDHLLLIDNDLDSHVVYDEVVFFEPEPGTALLLTVGWLGLMRRRRREHS